uniref:Uncharacterized protein n=1 Tax=Brassica oleracea var. oleracea TaxID=109376 RepID=A0A0D3BVN5_BRAOL
MHEDPLTLQSDLYNLFESFGMSNVEAYSPIAHRSAFTSVCKAAFCLFKSVDLLISSFSFAITHLLFLLRWCKEWSLLRFSLLSSPLVAPLRSSAIDIRAVVRRISSLAADDNRCWFICGSMEDEIELLLKDREIN